MTRYRCYFMFPEIFGPDVTSDLTMRAVYEDRDEPGLERLGAFITGFWLDHSMELCTGASESKTYWIPPGAIRVIEIVEQLEPVDDQWSEEERERMEAKGAEPIVFNKIGDKELIKRLRQQGDDFCDMAADRLEQFVEDPDDTPETI